MRFFEEPAGKAALFPTLLALLAGAAPVGKSAAVLAVLREGMALSELAAFLEEAEMQQQQQQQQQPAAAASCALPLQLACRLHPACWPELKALLQAE
jgi:hypothetical protein